MYYTLMRVHTNARGRSTLYSSLILDLWNEKYNTGYEINMNIKTRNCSACFNLIREYLGDTLKIETWDYLTRVLKEIDKK